MIQFGVGLPGPPVYGTIVEIEDGPKLFWNGNTWVQQPREYPTDADHEAAAGFGPSAADEGIEAYVRERAALAAEGPRSDMLSDEYEAVTLRFRGGWPTATSREIMEDHLKRWFQLFMEKQIDYGDRGDDLGLAGQYAEIHRKIGKLKRAMWDGFDLTGEQMDEVLLDLIGHCFLSLRYINHNNTGGKGKDK